MALPTTDLTIHLYAGDTDNVFTTANGGGSGVHSGVPGDGDPVEVWDDEEDGEVGDFAFVHAVVGVSEPTFRSTGSPMKHSCLDFDGVTGRLISKDQAGSSDRNNGLFVTASAWTIIVAVYIDTIDVVESTPTYQLPSLFLDRAQYMGLFVADKGLGGGPQIWGYNWDTNEDSIPFSIETGRTYIALLEHTGGNLTFTLIDDTGAESEDSTASGDTGSMTSPFLIGSQNGVATSFLDFKIGELAVYTAGLGGNKDAVKQHFMDNWLTLGATPGIYAPWLE